MRFAALPAGGFQRQESLDGEADILRAARDVMLEPALIGETALQPAKLAIVMRAQRCLQIVLAVELAFEEGTLHPAGRDQRQAARLRDAAEHGRDGAVEPHVRQHQNLGQLQMRPRQHRKKILDHAFGVVAVDQRRAERPERARPGPHDRYAERNRRLFDGERHQQPQAVLVFVAVADDGEPHLAVFEARHGRRQEARVEEHVGLDGAGAEIVEFLDQFEASGRRVDGEPARRTMVFQQFDMGWVDMAAGEAGKARDHGARRAAAHFLEKRDGGHQSASPAGRAGTNMAMTMPSLRQTVKERAEASKIIEPAVAIAAPHRPNMGIRTTLKPTLTASVRA